MGTTNSFGIPSRRCWLTGTRRPRIIAAADGFFLIDTEGNRYLDGISSLWCNVHGHRVLEIDEAVRRQLDRVAHHHASGLVQRSEYRAWRGSARLPRAAGSQQGLLFRQRRDGRRGRAQNRLSVSRPAPTGGVVVREAGDLFLSLGSAYHGDTIGAVSVGGMPLLPRSAYRDLLFKTVQVQPLRPWPFARPTRDYA